MSEPADHFDILIVGAGLSGIGAAHQLLARMPGKSLIILEGRERIGGTWDLFRYPGVRSDSDMYTLGYAHRPWTGDKAIVDGASILRYIEETAHEGEVGRHIRFGHRVTSASWSSAEARWTIEAEVAGSSEPKRFTCRWLHLCSGYYDYSGGHSPAFEGRDTFCGRIVHPQAWPADLDYAGKNVVVIGSGATAVTLVPAIAETAAHVVMLQRSPTYIVSRPSVDRVAHALRRALPPRLAYRLIRWKNVAVQMFFFKLARSRPEAVKRGILEEARKLLPPGYDVRQHLTPRYKPWDQRLCLVPDGDLFDAISGGRASIVTGGIERFVAEGVKLRSGQLIPADIIVTATGLNIKILGGVEFEVDSQTRTPSGEFAYKGMMFSGIPNLSYTFGYTNASWTLKADLTASYLCRLLRHMDRKGHEIALPVRSPEMEEVPFLDFTSSYVERARSILPKQGARQPWRVHQNYLKDLMALRFGPIDDGVIEFRRRATDG